MKERMNQSGITVRDEMIKDAIFIDTIENENDLSYCPTFYKVTNQSDYQSEDSFVQIHPRLYDRKWSSYKSHEMSMKTCIDEPINYGDLFHNSADDTWWICVQTDCMDDINHISKLLECNYLMYWQKEDGSIISRYCTVCNTSNSSNGETEGNVITLESNQFIVYMTYDDETDLLDNGKRIHISHSSRKCKAYELTRVDDITYGSGSFDITGILNLIFQQDETRTGQDTLVTLQDGTQVWICDYKDQSHSPTPPIQSNQNNIKSFITGRTDLKAGYPRTYTVTFSDENQNEISFDNINFSWNIDSELKDGIAQKVNGNTIELLADDKLVDETIRLQIMIDNVLNSEITITITDMY